MAIEQETGTELSPPVQSYRERFPAPPLAARVSSVWRLDVAAGEGGYEHRTVPNGSVEISYALGDGAVYVSGPQRGPTVERVASGTTVVGIRFRPGAAPAVLGPPASELVDLRVEVDRIWDGGARTLAERLALAGSPDDALLLLEEETALRSFAAPEPDQLVSAAVRRLQPWLPDGVAALASELELSPRQLRRRFVAALGFGPKAYQRIRRFQGFLALTQGRDGERLDLARLARRAGYADQAHLTRESSELTGLTPAAFLAQMFRSCGPSHDHEASYAGLRRALLAAWPGSAATSPGAVRREAPPLSAF
jgi:AraC-like DNA-binding protein